MDTFGINVKRLLLTLFVAFSLVGCLIVPKSGRTYHTVFEPQCCPNQGSARLISKEESWQITGKRGIDVVELTNSQFKMQVYYDDPFPALEMRLIVPAGEELIIEEESIAIIFDTATQQEITTFDIDWQITSEVNTKI